MKRILLIVGFLLALGAPSYAASCAGTFQIKDNAAATGTVVYTDSGDGSGNCVPDVKIFGTAPVSVAASQNKIGNVGGSTKEVCVAPTVTNATYGANVVVGGLLTFANLFTSTGSGVIQSVSVQFTTAQTVGFKLYPFNANPATTTWTDHSAAAINSADIFKVEPWMALTNADSGLGTMTVYSLAGLGQAYSTGATSGYFILVPQATTATTGGTTGVVQVCVTVLQDL